MRQCHALAASMRTRAPPAQVGCAENDPNSPVFDERHGIFHLFYQDHLGERQSMTAPWTNDPEQAIPYEGVRKCDFSRPAGKCLHGEGYGPFGTGQNCGDCGVKAGSGRCGSCWHLMLVTLFDLALCCFLVASSDF